MSRRLLEKNGKLSKDGPVTHCPEELICVGGQHELENFENVVPQVQVPSGALAAIEGARENQDSQGDLTISIRNAEDLETTNEHTAGVNIERIEHFESIPDYKTDSPSKNPIVVRTITEDRYHCIDGWTLIEKAISRGEARITCHIYETSRYSELELKIRKVEARTRPPGGRPRYGEMTRNVKILCQDLMASDPNLVAYHHGGSRRQASQAGNRLDNVIDVIASRLLKNRKTIAGYLNHVKHLTDEAIDRLIEMNAPKEFFGKAQLNKRIVVRELQQDRKPEHEIATVVSAKTLEWLDEYRRTKTIRSVLADPTAPTDEEAEQQKVGTQEQLTLFEHWTGGASDQAGPTTTLEDLKSEIKGSSERLGAVAEDEGAAPSLLIDVLTTEVKTLAKIIPRLQSLSNHKSGPEEEAP
jgi:hypothetical protein